MSIKKTASESSTWITSKDFTDGKGIQLLRCIVREGLSSLTETSLEFVTDKYDMEPEDLLAERMLVHMRTGDKDTDLKLYSGMTVTAEALGLKGAYRHFVVELRPKMWLLTKSTDNRVFQDKSTIDIIRSVLKEYDMSNIRFATSETYSKRVYCVQYRETDFDFLSRLMEEEGLYYYFDHSKSDASNEETIVICDGSGGHEKISGKSSVTFRPGRSADHAGAEVITEWTRSERITSGQVSLQDYDFLAPRADLKATQKLPKGTHSHKAKELYDYPGKYGNDSVLGKRLTRVRMEAEAVRFETRRAASTVKTISTGSTFKLVHDMDKGAFDDGGEYMITQAVHYIQEQADFTDPQVGKRLMPDRVVLPDGNDIYRVDFSAIPAKVPYRVRRTTPVPEISGPHTAIVTGPDGEEIHTDEHGRIKVQFHWDRLGKKDENSSCWVRVATPWSGKGWGAIALPRIGQEVMIQFEEGDPDKPLCTGMLYNDANRPPWALPANKTQSGVKTNSSKKGGGFNELMFEDKKDQELVRFQSQRDYTQIVKNDAQISIGVETKDPGNLTQIVQNDVSETIKEGNHTFVIEKGKQDITVKGNITETVEDGDHILDVQSGSQTLDIKTDRTATIDGKQTETITGNDTKTVKTGNISVKASAGKITLEAALSIELKVGATSVKLDASGVTIKGPMVKVQASGMAKIEAPMTNVSGSGMLVLKGGITMIN